MAYSELVKNFHKIRPLMRSFYVYGFRHRQEHDKKSLRSYDNERRIIESWLGDYLNFSQDADGKRMFLSVDSRMIAENPLYQAFKAKSFTDKDIMLHFLLMDMLDTENGLSMKDIMELLSEYMEVFAKADLPDESSVRKKLKEYEEIGLVKKEKKGKAVAYYLEKDRVNLASWTDALAFFSEAAPLGVVGSYIREAHLTLPEKPSAPDQKTGKISAPDRKTGEASASDRKTGEASAPDRKPAESSVDPSDYFRFKHHYILNALDSEILCSLLTAMGEEKTVILNKGKITTEMIPLKIYISTQTGRQYVLGKTFQGLRFYRLDLVDSVKPGDSVKTGNELKEEVEQFQSKIWGVSLKDSPETEHLEFVVHAEPEEYFIVQRLEREKRNGRVTDLGDGNWLYSTDVFDAVEMLPWIRTFIGRIVRLETDNPEVKQRFIDDMQAMYQMYGGEENALL